MKDLTLSCVLCVNRNFTEQIVGVSRLESDAMLDMPYRHAERDDFKCRVKWRPNSIAFWDNRCTMHLAMWDYFPQKRYGHRVTVAGTRPWCTFRGVRRVGLTVKFQ